MKQLRSLLTGLLLSMLSYNVMAGAADNPLQAQAARRSSLEQESQPSPVSAQAESKLQLAMAEDPPRKQPRASDKQKRRAEAKRKQEALARQQEEERAAEELQRANAIRVQELLVDARRNYAEGRLLQPPKNNAADAYQQILALDPTQLEALAGAKRIVDIIAAEAERTAAAGDRRRTQEYIGRIRALQPDDPSLLELDARFKAMSESPVILSDRQQERYGRSAESIERAFVALQRQPLDKQAIDEAITEYDRAAALVSLSPGLPMLKDRIIVAFPAAMQTELAQDNSRRALKVVEAARQRGWFIPELEPLERAARENLASK